MDIVCALRTFLRVAESGSFSAAAIDLNLTQPAVSRQVSALEEHLNTRLLHRTTNALALTVEGEQMIAMALKVVEAVDALSEASGNEAASVTGRVRLTLPAPLGLYVSDRLARLLERYPSLSVELIFREEPSDLVGEGIDLEVRLGPVSDNSLMCRRIGWTTAFLVAAPQYLERRGTPKTLDDVSAHECICYNRAGDARSWSFSDGSDEVTLRIAPRFIANSAVAVHRAVVAGGGLAVLSHILARPEIEAGRLASVLTEFPPTRLPINIVYPSRKNLPLRVRTVVDFLVEIVREDPLMTS